MSNQDDTAKGAKQQPQPQDQPSYEPGTLYTPPAVPEPEPVVEKQHYDLTNTPPLPPVPVDKDHPEAQPIPHNMGLPEAEAERLAEVKALQAKRDKEAAEAAQKQAEADAKQAEADAKKTTAPGGKGA